MSTAPHQGFNLYFAAADGPTLSTEQDALDLPGEYGALRQMPLSCP